MLLIFDWQPLHSFFDIEHDKTSATFIQLTQLFKKEFLCNLLSHFNTVCMLFIKTKTDTANCRFICKKRKYIFRILEDHRSNTCGFFCLIQNFFCLLIICNLFKSVFHLICRCSNIEFGQKILKL